MPNAIKKGYYKAIKIIQKAIDDGYIDKNMDFKLKIPQSLEYYLENNNNEH
jgi:hypothetical protein